MNSISDNLHSTKVSSLKYKYSENENVKLFDKFMHISVSKAINHFILYENNLFIKWIFMYNLFYISFKINLLLLLQIGIILLGIIYRR